MRTQSASGSKASRGTLQTAKLLERIKRLNQKKKTQHSTVSEETTGSKGYVYLHLGETPPSRYRPNPPDAGLNP